MKDFAEITVKDNGPGVPPNEMQYLLNPKTEGIGLFNAHQRLKMIHSEGLQISLNTPHGFIVKFKLYKE